MLKKFFMNVLSSFVGAWLAILLSALTFFILIVGIIGILISKEAEIPKDSVLRIELNGELLERETPLELSLSSLLAGELDQYQSVETLTAAIGEAKVNDRIKAIYLDCGALSSSPASVNAVRDALIEFKASGKKIFAYADTYSQASYFVATAADYLYLNPAGSVDLHGVGGQTLFLKDLFDKVGVQFQVVRVGEGKSAVEPYTEAHMSDYARRQTMEVLDTIWNQFSGELARSRKLKAGDIDSLINRDFISVRTAQFALDKKLVDGLKYRHEVEEMVSKACGQEETLENVATPQMAAMSNTKWSPVNNMLDNQIAVVYACGEIDGGFGGIDSQQTVKTILELAENDDVKGMVLRVNSPGGSAFGSEQIWEAVETFKKKNKPVAVSMGDYAASGGYYISCGADCIFADRFTVTGSIGIFGLIPNIQGLTQKLGMNVETVATNPDALFPTLFEPMTPAQTAAMQNMVNDGYELFVKRCAEGRKMKVSDIKAIADGRPISAPTALRLKLIDYIGSLEEAVNWTASQAKTGNDFHIGIYPQVDDTLGLLLGGGASPRLKSLMEGMSSDHVNSKILDALRTILGEDRIKALLPVSRVRI